jgi:hypothetical protein
MSKKPSVVALRAIRKTSHISRKATTKGAQFFGKVENKATRLIVDKAGSMDGRESINFDSFLFKGFPQITPVHPALPQLGQRPSVTVFAFLDPRGFYGGIATLLIVAASMAKKLDYDLRVAQTANYSKDNQVLKFLKSNDIFMRMPVILNPPLARKIQMTARKRKRKCFYTVGPLYIGICSTVRLRQ